MDILHIFDIIRKQILTETNKHLTTKQFMCQYFGIDTYTQFVKASGRSDYDNQCIVDTLEYYNMEDNVSGNTIIPVNWKKLWSKFKLNIIFNCEVTDIKYIDNKYIINNIFTTTKVLIATDIHNVKKLLPNLLIYNQIKSQPFLRLYGVFNDRGSQILSTCIPDYTFVDTPLQGLIPISQNLYVISYSDNNNANLLNQYIQNIPENQKYFEDLLTKTLHCSSLTNTLLQIYGYYTYSGTHYCTCSPIAKSQFIYQAQHPYPHIWVIGECVSLFQGWIEGALQSVEYILNELN